LALLAGLALLPFGAAAQEAGPAEPAATPEAPAETPEVALARRFNEAWNQHDLGAVLAFFAEDAQVRQSDTTVTYWGDSIETQDVYGTRLTLIDANVGESLNVVRWAAGLAEITEWTQALFRADHQVEATTYSSAARDGLDVVAWDYRVSSNPYRRLPGIEPTQGRAEATLRDGKVITLHLASDPASVARRQQAVETFLGNALLKITYAATETARRDPQPLLERVPSTQERGTSSLAGVVPLVVVALGATTLMAVFKRPAGA
jgi:hypothetical protein